MTRLQSLAALHEDAAQMADQLASVEADDKRGKDDLGELNEIVKAVQKGVEEGAETVLKNWEAVEGRMKSLEERIARLS